MKEAEGKEVVDVELKPKRIEEPVLKAFAAPAEAVPAPTPKPKAEPQPVAEVQQPAQPGFFSRVFKAIASLFSATPEAAKVEAPVTQNSEQDKPRRERNDRNNDRRRNPRDKTVAAVMRKTTSVTIKRHQTTTVSHKSASQSKSVVSVTNVMTAMNVQKRSVQNIKIVVINAMRAKRLNCSSKVVNERLKHNKKLNPLSLKKRKPRLLKNVVNVVSSRSKFESKISLPQKI